MKEEEEGNPNRHLYRRIEVLETKVNLLERERKTLIEILLLFLKRI